VGYLKIPNLYRDQTILNFKKVYALEKIHGTSTHIGWNGEKVFYFSGGCKYEDFVKLFDNDFLIKKFQKLGQSKITIYGEGYGGKMQGMSKTYGKDLKFVTFDVKIDSNWLDVPKAKKITEFFNFDFVDYQLVLSKLSSLDRQKNKKSIQAFKNNMGNHHEREGIVIRPLKEMTMNNEKRVIAKHKNAKFSETKTVRKVDLDKFRIKQDAIVIAEEYITPMRLDHVLDKFGEYSIEKTGDIIKAMIADIVEEEGEDFKMTNIVKKEMSRTSALLFKKRLNDELYNE
jgi:hypothetical protein